MLNSTNVKLDQLQLEQASQIPCGSETTGLEVGATGIALDASSDANLITKNRWADASNGNIPPTWMTEPAIV